MNVYKLAYNMIFLLRIGEVPKVVKALLVACFISWLVFRHSLLTCFIYTFVYIKSILETKTVFFLLKEFIV